METRPEERRVLKWRSEAEKKTRGDFSFEEVRPMLEIKKEKRV